MDFQEIIQGFFDMIMWFVNFMKDFVASIKGDTKPTTPEAPEVEA